MRFEYREIEISLVDIDDRTFKISTDEDTGTIAPSLRDIGLINPPILHRRNRNFTIVSGFRRIKAARGLSWPKMPYRVLPPDATLQQLARVAIADNSFQRSLDPVEISNALALLETCFPPSEIPREASRLGLPSNAKRRKDLLALQALPSDAKKAILDESIAVPVAAEISRMDETDMRALVAVFRAANCSLNKQREILSLATQIGARDDISVQRVLASLDPVLQDDDLDRNAKARSIREKLRKTRYPNIVAQEKNFARLVSGMKLPPRTTLFPPKDFEGGQYRFVLEFKDLNELSAHGRKLQEVVEGPEIRKILSD